MHLVAPARFGGLESVVGGLVSAMWERDEDVSIAATLAAGDALPDWLEGLARRGVPVERLALRRMGPILEIPVIVDLIRRRRVQVLHTHGYRCDLIGLLAARIAGVAIVSTAHGFVRVGFRRRVYCWLQLRALRAFDRVVAVSTPLLEELRGEGVSAGRLALIRNGLAAATGEPLSREVARQHLGLVTDGIVLGWVGRLSPEKAPELAVEALSRLSSRSAHLVFIGDGPSLGQLRSLVERLGLETRVTFAGSRPAAAALLTGFDVLVLSSRSEGTPMVLLEAMHAATPIVATEVGGVPDLLRGTGAALVRPGDPAALARGIDEMLANIDAARDAARETRSRLRRESTGGTDWVSQYVAFYHELCAASARRLPAPPVAPGS